MEGSVPVPVLSLYNVLVETPRLDRLVPLLPAPIKWGLIICIEKIKECMHSFLVYENIFTYNICVEENTGY